MSIPIAPKPPHVSTKPPKSGSSSSSSSGGKGHSGAPKGGGSSAPNSYASAYRQQKRDEARAKHKASTRYMEQAATLGKQAAALRHALGKKGFRHNLSQQLANLRLVTKQQDQSLMHDYRTRVGSLKMAKGDNEKAANAQGFANLANRSAERTAALSEATANGAGESDMLRAQQMSLANWNANQNEISRSFFDTLTSVNSSLRDLNTDTRTARINNALAADSDRGQLWQHYYDQRSESLTQLGNTLGQMSEYYGMAKEADGRGGKRRRETSRRSGNAFMQAAKNAGNAYKSPGVPKKLLGWDGHDDFEGRLNGSELPAAGHEMEQKKPEGATLRSWT